MKKIGIGIIGTGGISDTHIQGILSSKDAEVVALCDINETILKEKAERYQIPASHCFHDHIALLECSKVDAVSICTPNNCHYEIAADAIRYQKPFALEKPVTLNKDEAAKLMELVQQSKIANMVCFSYRFKAATRYAKWLISEGYIGDIRHVYVKYLQSWGRSKELSLIWRFVEELTGSGALGDLGSHMLDLTRFIVGDYTKVCAQAGTFITRRKMLGSEELGTVDVDDYCDFMAEIKGNIPATFNISRFAYGRGNYQEIEVYGSKGSLIYTLDADGTMQDTLKGCVGELYEENRIFQQLKIPEQFKTSQMQSFCDIINGNSDGLAATIADGYKNQEVLDALKQSFLEEKWVYLKGDHNESDY